MGLLDNIVEYFPASGHVESVYTPNRIPLRAAEERLSREAGIKDQSVVASIVSGIGRIDWNKVKSISDAEIDEFELVNGGYSEKRQQRTEIELLTENEKTKKPRPSGKFGRIAGLSLLPHFYPNLLNIVDADAEGRLHEVEKNLVNAFNGTTKDDVIKYVNQAGAPSLTKNLLNFCAFSSDYCRATCLVTTGNNPASNEAVNAKMRKTYMFLSEPEKFVALLHRQLNAYSKRCQRAGQDAVVRLNMLSDVPWYVICPELLEAHAPGGTGQPIIWYDYTKVPFWKSPEYQRVASILDLTFSFSGTRANLEMCREALEAGYRIALAVAPSDPKRGAGPITRTTWREIVASGIVERQGEDYFAVGELAKEFGGYWQVVDGDESDYRIDDPGSCIVALNFKDPKITSEVAPHMEKYLPLSREKFTFKAPEIPGLTRRYLEAKNRKSVWGSKDKRGQWNPGGLHLDPDDFAMRDALEIVDLFDEVAKREGVAIATKKAREKAQSILLEYQQEASPRPAFPNRRLAMFNSAPRTDRSLAYGKDTAISMFELGHTGILIGPHVPTIEKD